jgi:hypothetical protein
MQQPSTSFAIHYYAVSQYYIVLGSLDSVVGTATHYGLDSPGIESQWGRDFPHLSRLALGSTWSPVQWALGLSRGYSGRGVGLTTPPPSCAEANESVQLHLYSALGLYGLYRVPFTFFIQS